MSDTEENDTQNSAKDPTPVFKMPVLTGKRPGFFKSPKTAKAFEQPQPDSTEGDAHKSESENQGKPITEETVKEILKKEPSQPIPYKEPPWSGIPTEEYGLEVLKEGKIVEKIDLSQKSFYTLGRLDTCDIPLQHPSLSRYHCVVQYRADPDDANGQGMYVYDLGSTHGTFMNNLRLIPKAYQPLKVGQMFKVGGSKRFFILTGPSSDEEPESDLSVTELKQLKIQKEEERRKAEATAKLEEDRLTAEAEKKEEETGISWGFAEDADADTDLSENPYAANNDLELDDPKKTLRGWFEREGYELEYNVSEKAPGHFVCRVELPVDNNEGRPLVAEASLKGKKKEVVVHCALEACKILDNLGLLRQAKHESKAKRQRFRDDDDYYSSDEDTFLDRTGELEKKRRKRMEAAGKVKEEADTHESLVGKHKAVEEELESIDKQLRAAVVAAAERKRLEEESVDSLDAFMTSLKSTDVSDKATVAKLKAKRIMLQKEELRLKKLVELTRPAQVKV